MALYNKINGEELKAKMRESKEERVTLSFYKYHAIPNPEFFRNFLFNAWDEIGVLGRVYVAKEGINAQISVPIKNFDAFSDHLNNIDFLNSIRLNIAIDDDGKSFFKLKIKVRGKIVADGLEDDVYDPSDCGIHVDAEGFNKLADDPDTVILDMRNHYESEIGHFENAYCPDVDTFRESLPVVEEELADKKDKKLLMYCTGGIRCEKASAYFKQKGFKDVYQLEGGIINYAKQVTEKGLPNKFKGKNFVFDERLGERISEEIISQCHQCENKCDTHVNCKNVGCNLLFLQCDSCGDKYEGCCSEGCMEINKLDDEAKRELRKQKDSGIRIFSKGRFGKRAKS